MHSVFVAGSSNPQNVSLNIAMAAPEGTQAIYLFKYSLHGVPVTLSIPDQDYYLLEVENHGTTALTNTNQRVFLLQLNGIFTASSVNEPVHVADLNGRINQFQLRLKNPNGTTATVDSFAFWFYLC